jgi:beta-lactamase regulating signal transducer with metallopeptidase domain
MATPVLLAPAIGPAVVGALRPTIVVPEWSLDLSDEQRALMLAHEREHVRARDPLVLHAAAMVALLMPWNVAAWWLNRRLRLAVELDCDARVLAGGRDARSYGALLLDVCARRRDQRAARAGDCWSERRH